MILCPENCIKRYSHEACLKNLLQNQFQVTKIQQYKKGDKPKSELKEESIQQLHLFTVE